MILNDVTVGQRYIITIDDCCVNAKFEATVVDIELRDEDAAVRFDNGVTVEDFGGVSAVALENLRPGVSEKK